MSDFGACTLKHYHISLLRRTVTTTTIANSQGRVTVQKASVDYQQTATFTPSIAAYLPRKALQR